jgi:hypothetical protein
MGLDQYLYETVYVSHYAGLAENYPTYQTEYDRAETIMHALDGMTANELSEEGSVKVKFRIMTWRKAHMIHGWFVRNLADGVDECQEIYVSFDNLKTLRDTCDQVLFDPNPDHIRSVLPATDGFFFGVNRDDPYDNWFWDDGRYTRDGLTEIIKTTEAWLEIPETFVDHKGDLQVRKRFEPSFLYQASW